MRKAAAATAPSQAAHMGNAHPGGPPMPTSSTQSPPPALPSPAAGTAAAAGGGRGCERVSAGVQTLQGGEDEAAVSEGSEEREGAGDGASLPRSHSGSGCLGTAGCVDGGSGEIRPGVGDDFCGRTAKSRTGAQKQTAQHLPPPTRSETIDVDARSAGGTHLNPRKKESARHEEVPTPASCVPSQKQGYPPSVEPAIAPATCPASIAKGAMTPHARVADRRPAVSPPTAPPCENHATLSACDGAFSRPNARCSSIALRPPLSSAPAACPFQVLSDIALDEAIAWASHPNVHVRRATHRALADFLRQASVIVPARCFSGLPPLDCRSLEAKQCDGGSKDLPYAIDSACKWMVTGVESLVALTDELSATCNTLERRTSMAVRTMPIRAPSPALASPGIILRGSDLPSSPATPAEVADSDHESEEPAKREWPTQVTQHTPMKKNVRWRHPLTSPDPSPAERSTCGPSGMRSSVSLRPPKTTPPPSIFASVPTVTLSLPHDYPTPSQGTHPQPFAPGADAWAAAMLGESNVTSVYGRRSSAAGNLPLSSRMKNKRRRTDWTGDDDG